MKIHIDVEIPDEETCSILNCNFHDTDNTCKLFICELERYENSILMTETYKCIDCIAAIKREQLFPHNDWLGNRKYHKYPVEIDGFRNLV